MISQQGKFAEKFTTKSSRLTNWDYSTPGFYFVTICTLNGNNFFGKIIDKQMQLSKIGQIAKTEILNTPKIRPYLNLYAWVIMPNHVHFLINIRDFLVETPGLASLHDNPNQCGDVNLQTITLSHKNHPDFFHRLNQKSKQLIPKTIQQFKSSVKRQCNQQKLFFAWQSRFHDRLANNQKELSIIQNYIINNPANWPKDKYYA